jgi:hypothetical protein
MLSVLLAVALLADPTPKKKPKLVDITGTRVDIYPLHLKHPPAKWHCKHLVGTEYSCASVKASDLEPKS